MKTVINNNVSRVPSLFLDYCRTIREIEDIKQREPGGPAMRQAGAWWGGVDQSLRCYLLSSLCGDDWPKYLECRWVALPDGLRSEISKRARSIERQLRSCPWR